MVQPWRLSGCRRLGRIGRRCPPTGACDRMLAVATPDTTASQQLMRAMRSLEAIFLVGVEGVTEVLLVRHADCYRDLTDVVDPPLSALGKEQARLLGARVNRHKPAAVYASPLRRAMETASAITDTFKVDQR